MSNPGSLSTSHAKRAEPKAAVARPASLPDSQFWQQYLLAGEKPLWLDRPADTFRLGGMSMGMGACCIFALLLLTPLLLPTPVNAKIVMVAILLILFGLLVTLGPALLDRKNRRNRRYALTPNRAMATRDARHGHPRVLELGPNTQVLRMEDRGRTEFIVAILNRGTGDSTGHALQFERLSGAQADAVLDALAGQGIAP